MATYRSRGGIEVPERAVRTTFSRSSGPGGQHVNRTESRVQVRIVLADCDLEPKLLRQLQDRLGDVVDVEDSSTRSQWRNRATALRRALELLDEAGRQIRPRVATRPSRAAQRRRLESKARRARTKELRRRPTED
jgi:ribosome-associated protein